MKKRKKNNHAERQYRMSLAMTKGYGLARVNDSGVEAVDLVKFKRIDKVSYSTAKMMTDIPHRWNLFLIVNCTESNGKVKLICDQIQMQDRRMKSQISDFLSAEYDALLNDCASKMTVNYAGWIATTMRDIEPSDSEIELLMNQFTDNIGV